MSSRFAQGLCRWCVVLAVVTLSVVRSMADSQPTAFSETWETYTNGVTPYGEWILDKGDWCSISDHGRGGGKCFLVNSNVMTRLRHKIDFARCKDFVLQGWLYDSGGEEMNRCILGLTDEANAIKVGNPMIRMGIGASGQHMSYTIVFFDRLQAKNSIMVDTKMSVEKGWHFMRLEIMHDRSVNYRIYNAARTTEKRGSFGWVVDRARFNYITIGSGQPTPGIVGWDDIQAGPLEQIAVPPLVPDAKPNP